MYREPTRSNLSFRRMPSPKLVFAVVAILAAAIFTCAGDRRATTRVGRQPDGSYIVSTQQRVRAGSIPFNARPSDMAMHPTGTYVAVLNQASILLISPQGMLADSHTWLGSAAGFRGVAWSPDGNRLFASCASGYEQELRFNGGHLQLHARIDVTPEGSKGNPRPGGMAITRNGKRLYVALTDRNSVAEVDLDTSRMIRTFRVQNLPFEVRLSRDENTLVVSNWGGRTAADNDERSESGNAVVVVDPRGAAASGTVCLIRRDNGANKVVNVGIHPTAIAVDGDHAYVTNSASDSITDIKVSARKVVRTLPLRWGKMNLFGSMPCAIAIRNGVAYICNGGDNALCVMHLASGRVLGFYPAG